MEAVARREVLNNPVRLGEQAPDILICTAARRPKLARAARPAPAATATTATATTATRPHPLTSTEADSPLSSGASHVRTW
jgi:hypothetical protein